MNKYKEIIKNNKGIFTIIILGTILLIMLLYYYEIKIPKSYKREEIDTFDYEVYQYDDNEYKLMNITDETMSGIYYNYIKNLMLNNQEKLWDLCNDSLKSRFKNLKSFKEYISKKRTKNTFSNTLRKYSIKNGSIREIYLGDTEENKFTISEKSVWNIVIVDID